MKHMSPEQISKFVAESGTVEGDQHVCSCALCAGEVARVRDVLSLFGSSVREWTGTQSRLPVLSLVPPVRHRPVRHSLAWILAGPVLAVLIGIPLYQTVKDRQVKAQAEQDALLFESVDSQLSRRVPVAMESLMELMSGENIIDEKDVKESTVTEKKSTKSGGVQ